MNNVYHSNFIYYIIDTVQWYIFLKYKNGQKLQKVIIIIIHYHAEIFFFLALGLDVGAGSLGGTTFIFIPFV